MYLGRQVSLNERAIVELDPTIELEVKKVFERKEVAKKLLGRGMVKGRSFRKIAFY